MTRLPFAMPTDRQIRRHIGSHEVTALGRTMKAEVRKTMLRTRTMMPVEQRAAASRAIAERVIALPAWAAARSVALFRSIPRKAEVDTGALDAAARAAGKRVAYPVIEGDEGAIEEASMGFRWVDELADLVSRGRGFPEPPRDAAPVEALDLVVVPGLAFDPAGYRVGYGAGLYDRSLPHFRGATKVGIAFDFQLAMELPRGEHDVPVDLVVTEKRVIATGETA